MEKKTENDLQIATGELKKEQDVLEKITKNLTLNNHEKNFITYLNSINKNLENAKNQLDNNKNYEARDTINNILVSSSKSKSESL